MVTNEDMDAIINLWLEEWHGPLAELLPEEQNTEGLLLHQVNGEYHEGDDTQDDPLQEHIEDDDDMDESDHHPSEHQPRSGASIDTCATRRGPIILEEAESRDNGEHKHIN